MGEKISDKKFRDQVTEFLESNSKKSVATKVVLAIIALGGAVFIGAAAPGIIKAADQLRRLGEQEGGEVLKKKNVQSALSRFKRDGYVQYKERKDGSVKIFLTEKGREHVFDFTRRMTLKKPLVWDRKWRVVIYDIPVKKRKQRDMFGHRIKEMGFKQLQKSVWVHPYKCEDEVLFLAKQLGIVKSIEILTVQKLVHSEKLKKKFRI